MLFGLTALGVLSKRPILRNGVPEKRVSNSAHLHVLGGKAGAWKGCVGWRSADCGPMPGSARVLKAMAGGICRDKDAGNSEHRETREACICIRHIQARKCRGAPGNS